MASPAATPGESPVSVFGLSVVAGNSNVGSGVTGGGVESGESDMVGLASPAANANL